MSEPDVKKLMESLSRIPEDPIPDPDVLRTMLIDQILAFQARYNFTGVKHTQDTLSKKSDAYLERLCNMQLYGIATSKVNDAYLS